MAPSLRSLVRLIVVASVAMVAVSAAPAAALAHHGGKAVPVIAWTVREVGPLQAEIDLRARDEDEGEPVRGADVRGVGRVAF